MVLFRSTALCIIAALASLLRGKRYIADHVAQGAIAVGINPTSGAATSIEEVPQPAASVASSDGRKQ